MSDRPPRLLFIPVSGRFGMGEYARSLAIANGAAARWPGAAVEFMLSRAAPYAAASPYPATLLESSPTFHSAAVVERIAACRPDVVIFDNAGRTAQLRAARRCGARVVYISARPRQRRKAFRLRWMRLIDEHWIAYPEFIAGSLGFLERLKLGVMKRPRVRYLDVILSAARAPTDSLLSRTGFAAETYVLMVPGGGTGHPGAGNALEQFAAAARGLAARGIDTILVGQAVGAGQGGGAGQAVGAGQAGGAGQAVGVGKGGGVHRDGGAGAESLTHLRTFGSLPQSELAEMMRGARVIVANGGSTLLQSIACGKACIAVPIAGDQAGRIRRCESAGVAIAAPLDGRGIEDAATALLNDEPARGQLAGRARALGLADGVDVALRALDVLLANQPGPG